MQYIHKDRADTLYRQLCLKIAMNKNNSWTTKTCSFDTAEIVIVCCIGRKVHFHMYFTL